MSLTPVEFGDMETGWSDLLHAVLEQGRVVVPRGKPTRELGPVMFTLTDPSKAVVCNTVRKLNHAFGAAEFLWVISGQDEVDTLAFYNSQMRNFADVRPMPTRTSLRMFGAYGVPIREQMPYVLRNLTADNDSRQAVITIWRPSPPPTKDVPCTVMLQFQIRGGRLNMFTVMRSNDLWLGTPYDVPLFCRVQAYVASELNVPLGTYTHAAGSLHIYDSNRSDVMRVLEAGSSAMPTRPDHLKITGFDPLVAPGAIWERAEDIARDGEPYFPMAMNLTGWSDLVQLMQDFATRKRLKDGS